MWNRSVVDCNPCLQTVRHDDSSPLDETSGLAALVLKPPSSEEDEDEAVEDMLKQTVKELESALQVRKIFSHLLS